MTDSKENDGSNHPEMNEEGVEFSKNVPDTPQELIDLNFNRDNYSPSGKLEEVDYEMGHKLSMDLKEKCNI